MTSPKECKMSVVEERVGSGTLKSHACTLSSHHPPQPTCLPLWAVPLHWGIAQRHQSRLVSKGGGRDNLQMWLLGYILWDVYSLAQHRKSIFLASGFNVIFTSIKAFTRVYRFCGGRQALVLCRENRLAPLTCLAILQPACSVIYHFLWLLKRCQFLWTVCVGWYTNTIHLTHYCIILPFVQCRCDLSYMLCGNFPVTLIVTTWESLPRAGNS